MNEKNNTDMTKDERIYCILTQSCEYCFSTIFSAKAYHIKFSRPPKTDEVIELLKKNTSFDRRIEDIVSIEEIDVLE